MTYFDHNSTSPLRSTVLEAMLPWLQSQHGNPNSGHSYGRNAREAIEQARWQVAEAVGVQASQVIFTSGGTEANNFAVKGLCARLTPSQLLVSAVEHPCVTQPAKSMAQLGWQVKSIAVDTQGQIDLDKFDAQLQQETGLVTTMLVNNETGVIQALADIAKLAKRQGACVHTDAVQGLGKIAIDFHTLGVHSMSLSAHKVGGPIGVGALVIDKRADIMPLLEGGGQERGLRSGTENVAGIVGFGLACQLASQQIKSWTQHTLTLKQQLEVGLKGLSAHIFSEQAERVPNTSFFAFPNIEGATLVSALDKAGYAVASGSACSSNSNEPSHVLLAMGVATDLALGAVRVSLGEQNTQAQIKDFLRTVAKAVQSLKDLVAMTA